MTDFSESLGGPVIIMAVAPHMDGKNVRNQIYSGTYGTKASRRAWFLGKFANSVLSNKWVRANWTVASTLIFEAIDHVNNFGDAVRFKWLLACEQPPIGEFEFWQEGVQGSKMSYSVWTYAGQDLHLDAINAAAWKFVQRIQEVAETGLRLETAPGQLNTAEILQGTVMAMQTTYKTGGTAGTTGATGGGIVLPFAVPGNQVRNDVVPGKPVLTATSNTTSAALGKPALVQTITAPASAPTTPPNPPTSLAQALANFNQANGSDHHLC